MSVCLCVLWCQKAKEFQTAADTHDTQRFYEGLKAVYGPQARDITPIQTEDGTMLITDCDGTLQRWAEDCNAGLTRSSALSEDVLDDIPRIAFGNEFADTPTILETTTAVNQMSSGKAPRDDCLPAEIFKYGGSHLIGRLHQLFQKVWEKEKVPQDFRNATIVRLYKKRGNRSICDNHRGISLLCTAGKILSCILVNRLSLYVSGLMIPESQCGFRRHRSTTDMIFTARQMRRNAGSKREIYSCTWYL